MKHSWKVGFNFGLTSGVITTLGLMTGLYSGTGSKMVVLGGIFTIAVADSLSDALGIHISEESQEKNAQKQVWEATLSTFFFKLITALTFVIPFIFLNVQNAVIIDFCWGAILLSLLSINIARKQKLTLFRVISEHLIFAIFVVICTYFVGKGISSLF